MRWILRTYAATSRSAEAARLQNSTTAWVQEFARQNHDWKVNGSSGQWNLRKINATFRAYIV